jgi:hypothetical protein
MGVGYSLQAIFRRLVELENGCEPLAFRSRRLSSSSPLPWVITSRTDLVFALSEGADAGWWWFELGGIGGLQNN